MSDRAVALLWGALCHGAFAVGGAAMFFGMWFGMSRGLGPFEGWAAVAANLALIAQFPIAHSFLLTRRGRAILARLGPAPHGATLATTTFAAIASVQLALLFGFWSPSGVIWWRAEGPALALTGALYLGSWALLTKASFDAGPELQSGLLGWRALWRGEKPVFPDMPTRGMFRHLRQPIYLTFALTLWTVPVWTPDQLALAAVLTAYCYVAPRLKERRFARIHGARWEAYRAQVPYWIPRLAPARFGADVARG